jgi:aspartyl-tRNA(Asn)/glutamyl-tRNA(Gln) amidotransferase subunit A
MSGIRIDDEIWWKSAAELADLVRGKEVSPVELCNSLIERIAVVNPKINAYVTICPDAALAHAKEAEEAVIRGDHLGPLHGVPFSVKDVTFTKGVRTTMGSQLMESFIPKEDAVLVSRLKAAGGLMVGKTNTPEFATIPYTDNPTFGVTRNPWDLARTTGGSSGGSAAAVAAGLGPLATGNDAGGSIRIPASCCGVVGLKPQYGRIPCYPLFHLWESMNYEGPITRTVRDAALMLDVMSGHHPRDRHSLPAPSRCYNELLEGNLKGRRAAWSATLSYAAVSAEVRGICLKSMGKFCDMGVEVEEASPDIANPEETYGTILNAELGAMLSLYGPLEEIKDKLDPQLASRIAPVGQMSAYDYLKATFARRELAAKMGEFFETYDLLFTPTIGVPAWEIGLPGRVVSEIEGKPVSRRGWLLTFPFNLSGHPAISVPAGWSHEGLPVGLQIIGRHYAESTVLRAAAAFEQVQPWAHRRPDLHQKRSR